MGTPVMIRPIADTNNYQINQSGFSGNSLSDQNILIVTNIVDGYEKIKDIFKNENCYLSILYCDNDTLNDEMIKKSSAGLLGSYTHIINLVVSDNTNMQLKAQITVINDPVRCVYQWLQVESGYLIEKTSYATICTAYYYNDTIFDIEKNSQNGGISSLIKGLGGVLSNHGIIENGLISSSKVPFEEMLHTTIYLSGKYGQIMAGEVLHMELRR
ncbi:hypothetical protein SAMN05421659_11858 [[Clostridium] fimetarium]|uniref:Uncharacterized protein n=2 Tax=[Clostridium] fimetarium TaxID=99656 RepID=A0A1I0RLK8_9FIRM|nr:hypothetical protein SAMN05421659_11858 [[Clostridium] fimetarium]